MTRVPILTTPNLVEVDEFSLLTTTTHSKTRPCFLMGVGITCQACVSSLTLSCVPDPSTMDRFAKCPKDHSTDDKDDTSTIEAQPMYPMMPNNMQHSDYRPILNAQVPMTGSQHVTSQPPNTAMYMHSGNVVNLTVCTEHISQFISLLNTSINENFLALGTKILRLE